MFIAPRWIVYIDGVEEPLGCEPFRDRITPIPAELLSELLKVSNEHRVGLVVGRWSSMGRDLPLACKLAGIERATANDLRRTYASWLVNEGAPLKVVANLLGHKSTRMVDLVYGRVADSTAAAWVAKANATEKQGFRRETERKQSAQGRG